ncbi:MAG: electron transfer flavoprotein subunit beta/FixA family protein [Candidatus Heimdallarchaeota archaeon]
MPELEIVVCIKQVIKQDYYPKVRIDPITKTLRREEYPAEMNPLDKHALEAALQLKDEQGGRVTILSMGPPQTEETLREALAMGADEAILLCDQAFAGADTLATSYTLAAGIRTLNQVDLILCGNETVDSGTGQVGPQLAVLLDIPAIIYVRKIHFIEDFIIQVERTIEEGYLLMETQLPALLAVVKEINTPRYPSLMGIADAAKKTITYLTVKDINLNTTKVGAKGSPTETKELFTPKLKKRQGEILKGPPDKVSRLLVHKLHERGMV